ncbi:MAG: hypothetical protein PVF87_08960 [Acidimicrobiia bacterium]
MTQELELADERHPIRFLIKFVIFAGLLYAAGKFLSDKKKEYSDLTESEARSKFMETVGPKVGDETAEEIADQVIPKLKERGLLKSDPAEQAAEAAEEAADAAKEAAEDLQEKVEDVSDQVSEAVDSVVKE